MNSYPLHDREIDGVKVVRIASGFCAVCSEQVRAETAFALGEPHHAVLHDRCAPFFDFESLWPHTRGAHHYLRSARRRTTLAQRRRTSGGGTASADMDTRPD